MKIVTIIIEFTLQSIKGSVSVLPFIPSLSCPFHLRTALVIVLLRSLGVFEGAPGLVWDPARLPLAVRISKGSWLFFRHYREPRSYSLKIKNPVLSKNKT